MLPGPVVAKTNVIKIHKSKRLAIYILRARCHRMTVIPFPVIPADKNFVREHRVVYTNHGTAYATVSCGRLFDAVGRTLILLII